MLSFVLLSVLAQAPASRIDERPISTAVQTADGALHAIREGRVARFDDGWRPLEGPSSGVPVGLITDASRGAVSVWSVGEGAEVWRHGPKESGRVATLTSPLPADLSMTAQADGTVWLTGSSRRLISIARDGKVTTSVLEASWLVMPEAQKKVVCRGLTANGCCEADGEVSCGRVRAFERQGSMWFWSTGSSNSFVLRGLLRRTPDGTFTPWTAAGLPEAVTRAVLPFERHALLAAQSALYRLDLDRRTVSPEPFPPLKDQTPQDILSLHRSEAATWALVQRGHQQREGQLFRDDGSGFQRVLDGVGGLVWHLARPTSFVSAKAPDGREHVWLATQEGPLWHLGGPAPELVDWAAGLATRDISGLFIVPVGAKRTVLVVTDRSQGTFRLPVFEPVTSPVAALQRFPVQKRSITWLPDGRLFWLEGVEPLALHEWTGSTHELRRPPTPLHDAFTSASTVIADDAEVWVVPDPSRGFSDQGPALARFGAGASWTIHPNAPMALAAGIERASTFHGLDADALMAVTREGARCMRDPNSNLTCASRDGSRRTWTATEVSGETRSSFFTAPTIDAEGQLRVVVNRLGTNTAWTWRGAKWVASEEVPFHQAPTTVGCAGSRLVAQGTDGRAWYSTRDGLMVARNGLCRMRRAGLSLDGVVMARFDSNHHDVLIRGDELIVLLDADTLPETTLGAPRSAGGQLVLEVKGAPIAEVRLDGAAWSAVELKQSRLELDGLSRGRHRLEVRAADEHLRVDPTPATLDFVVR